MKRGQTPYTPAEGIIYQLNTKVKQIYKVGVEKYVEKTKKLAEDFRFRIEGLPFSTPSYTLSNALTPILVKNKNAYEIFLKLKDQYNVIVTPSGGKLKNVLLRIGHIGELTIDDNKMLVQILRRMV